MFTSLFNVRSLEESSYLDLLKAINAEKLSSKARIRLTFHLQTGVRCHGVKEFKVEKLNDGNVELIKFMTFEFSDVTDIEKLDINEDPDQSIIDEFIENFNLTSRIYNELCCEHTDNGLAQIELYYHSNKKLFTLCLKKVIADFNNTDEKRVFLKSEIKAIEQRMQSYSSDNNVEIAELLKLYKEELENNTLVENKMEEGICCEYSDSFVADLCNLIKINKHKFTDCLQHYLKGEKGSLIKANLLKASNYLIEQKMAGFDWNNTEVILIEIIGKALPVVEKKNRFAAVL